MKHGEAEPFQLSSMSDVSSVLELVTDSIHNDAPHEPFGVRSSIVASYLAVHSLPTYDGGSTLIEWSHRFT